MLGAETSLVQINVLVSFGNPVALFNYSNMRDHINTLRG